jgi:hypothetical protein
MKIGEITLAPAGDPWTIIRNQVLLHIFPYSIDGLPNGALSVQRDMFVQTITGQSIEIRGKFFTVLGVEAFCTFGLRVGWQAGLMVKL